jgi:uncharacterized protein YgbK (DUF1537 family)
MEVIGAGCLPFAPAYPALGRTTREGVQYLKGVPIHKTAMAADPLNPIRESSIPKIIAGQSRLPVGLIGKPSELAAAKAEGILVFDSETGEELKEIAAALKDAGLLRASAGCAGFAEALMGVLPWKEKDEKKLISSMYKPEIPPLPVLVVSGSRHPVSVEQVKAAIDGGAAGFAASGADLMERGWFKSGEAEALAAGCALSLKERGIAVLGTGMALGLAEEKRETEKSPPPEIFAELPGRLGILVKTIIEKTGPLNLVIFGGDTLLGIMKELEYDYIIPRTEIRPGVVLAEAAGKKGKGVIVTKSGAFGEKDLVSVIAKYL